MKWKQLSDEVYAAAAPIVGINYHDIALLKENIAACKNNRIRICAHQLSSDPLHEMLIVITKGSYIRPHKHLNKSESFHIIEGLLDVVIFDDDGNIIKIIEMGNITSGKHFFYRLSDAHFHTLILKSDLVVFHETTNGPFRKDDTLYAPWSPAQGDKALEQTFMSDLADRINAGHALSLEQ
jgi:cupin fold WbuC family metalloprotein